MSYYILEGGDKDKFREPELPPGTPHRLKVTTVGETTKVSTFLIGGGRVRVALVGMYGATTLGDYSSETEALREHDRHVRRFGGAS